MTPPSSIRQELVRAAERRDRSRRQAVALTVAGVAGLVLLVGVLLDYVWLLSPSIRGGWAALLVLVGGVGAAAWAVWGRRRTSIKEAALEVEASRSETGCEVSTAAEYAAGERQVSGDHERELVEALQRKAAVSVAQAPVREARVLLWPRLAAVAAVVGLGVFLVSAPASGTALRRIATPWTAASYAQITVTPGAVEIPVGRPLEIRGQFVGRIPETAELQIREKGRDDWQRVTLVAPTNGVFRHALGAVSGPFSYRVTGLDAVSGEFQVTTYVPPAVKDLRVRLEPPAYTGLQPSEQASADIAIVRGTRALFRIVPTVPLGRAELVFTNGTVVPLRPDASRQWVAEVPVQRDGEFRIAMVDERGRAGVDEVRHHITAIPDAPPKVDFTEPGEDIRAAATNRIALRFAASDDFGVAGVRILYHRLGSPEQELKVPRLTRRDGEFLGEAELDLGSLKLEEYELVAYHAEARDNNTLDGPGIGKSPTYFIEITDKEGGKCLSQCKGQKVNLLVIQKQIIADTAALATSASTDRYQEMAARQRDAVEFGRLYQEALAKTGAPVEAQGMMNSAVTKMEKAAAALKASRRDAALPPEESALADLYQVVGLLPELKNLPVTPQAAKASNAPPAVQVVLQAILKQKKEPANREELARLLEQVQQLNRQQAAVNAASRSSGESQGKGTGAGKGEGEGQGQSGKEGQANNGKAAKGKAGQGKKGPAKEGQGKQGEGKEGVAQDGKGDPESKPADPKDLAALAPKQEQMSAEARALAERIQRLAGKGSRLGHGAGQRVGDAAGKMAQAAQAMRSGKGESAGTAGDQSASSLGAAEALLEALLSGRPELSDVTAEEAPKQYEAAIADYFRRLSRAE